MADRTGFRVLVGSAGSYLTYDSRIGTNPTDGSAIYDLEGLKIQRAKLTFNHQDEGSLSMEWDGIEEAVFAFDAIGQHPQEAYFFILVGDTLTPDAGWKLTQLHKREHVPADMTAVTPPHHVVETCRLDFYSHTKLLGSQLDIGNRPDPE